MEMALAPRLKDAVPRLELLGFTLEAAQAEYRGALEACREQRRSRTTQSVVSCFATTSTSITPIMPKIKDGAHRQALLAKDGIQTSACVCRGGLSTLVGMFRVG